MIDITKRKKLFIRFLKENNCYMQYIKNYSINLKPNSRFKFKNLDDLYNNSTIKNNNPSRTEFLLVNEISSAFSWMKTEQGFDYWDLMENKWMNVLKNNNFTCK